jgi:outer membrane lipoprotein-sorting protein
MKPTEDMEKVVERSYLDNLHVSADAEMDQRILADAVTEMRQVSKRRSAPAAPIMWRIIMKSRMAKLATAAVTIVAVIVGVTILSKSATPAWAIEQTIEAIGEFRGLYSSGVWVGEYGKEYEAEFWARPNKDGTGSGDFRMETRGGEVIVVNELQNVTYKYDPNQNVVLVESGNRFYCRPWINDEFFRKMKTFTNDWREEYGEDESTGRDSVFVTARNLEDNQSYEFQFDLATKLPVRATVWQNADFKGKPNIDAEKIVYNPKFAEGVFNFEVPNGATVIDRTED